MVFNSKIFNKYLGGRFSLNEKKIVDDYFENNEYAEKLDHSLADEWEKVFVSDSEIHPNLDPVLNKIGHQIFLETSANKTKLRKLLTLYSRVAAVLLLPILFVSVYSYLNNFSGEMNSSWVEIHSPYGARTKFMLPDGSKGWLNGGSAIRFHAQFDESRKVKLDGEAYFDVVKNPHLPFIVDAHGMNIRVLGTAFNVVSYDNDSITEVVVARGKVQVTGHHFDFDQKLLPNQRIVMNRLTKQFANSTVDAKSYTSWKNGKLVFQNEDLSAVIRKLSRFYNVDFEVNQNVDKSQRFRAIVEDESLPEILRYMTLTMSIGYQVHERVQNSDGTISKRKVIITNSIKN